MEFQEYIDGLRGRKIAVIGAGVSNLPLIELLCNNGDDVTVCDKRTAEAMGTLADQLTGQGAKLHLGEDYLEGLDRFDLVFRTPGLLPLNEHLQAAAAKGVEITSEMEVFFRLCPCKTIAITGSDGKTTTSTVIAELLRASGKTVHLGGNIGHPLLCDIPKMTTDDICVLELSSFQLHSMTCKPNVSVITNVSPNHLDVHPDYEDYQNAKKSVYRYQDENDRLVVNADNTITDAFGNEAPSQVYRFSRQGRVARGAYYADGAIWFSDGGETKKVIDIDEIKIPGMHNVENYLTAIAAVWGEVPVEVIHNIAKNFGGVEHRIELVRELDGVKWYNDSIATSPTRTIAGLSCFDQKVILIGGGYDKHIPYEPLAPHLIDKVKLLILSGPTAPKIAAALQNDPNYNGEPEVIFVNSMEEAVATAYGYAEEGDIVTLSPASASFDLYPNFEVRGKHYKELVGKLGQLDGIPAEKL